MRPLCTAGWQCNQGHLYTLHDYLLSEWLSRIKVVDKDEPYLATHFPFKMTKLRVINTRPANNGKRDKAQEPRQENSQRVVTIENKLQR